MRKKVWSRGSNSSHDVGNVDGLQVLDHISKAAVFDPDEVSNNLNDDLERKDVFFGSHAFRNLVRKKHITIDAPRHMPLSYSPQINVN